MKVTSFERGKCILFRRSMTLSSFTPIITYSLRKNPVCNMSSSRGDRAPLTDDEMGKGEFFFSYLRV